MKVLAERNPLNKEISLFQYLKTRFYIGFFNVVPNHKMFNAFRSILLKKSGFNLKGKNIIFSPISISPKTIPENIEIGENTFINSGCRFSAPIGVKIRIGKNSLVGPNVCFESVNHFLPYNGVLARGASLGNIVIGEGVWIGLNSIILQNVKIGKGSVIAAQSMVKDEFGSNLLIGGTPAKVIKEIQQS